MGTGAVWRLRQALRALTPSSDRALRVAAAAVLDHNGGFGAGWNEGMLDADAMRHLRDMFALSRRVVAGALGPDATRGLPPALPRPAPTGTTWPERWRALVAERAQAARVRVGPGFLETLVDDSSAMAPAAIEVSADERHLLVHTRLDRAALRSRMRGSGYNAVIEIALRLPCDSLALAPERSASARAGKWLRGGPPASVISPEAVRVIGPALELRADAPLVVRWALRSDATRPEITWLQALAFKDDTEGEITHHRARWPSATLYPGEPQRVDFDVLLTLEQFEAALGDRTGCRARTDSQFGSP